MFDGGKSSYFKENFVKSIAFNFSAILYIMKIFKLWEGTGQAVKIRRISYYGTNK
jgi:hypothetical protein